MTRLWMYFCFLSLLLGSAACDADRLREGLPLTGAELAFFDELSRAVLDGDRKWVLHHVAIPLTVRTGSAVRTINSLQEVGDQYDRIFTSRVISMLWIQRPDRLFKNAHGIMVGNGELWFSAASQGKAESGESSYDIIAISNGVCL
jgi:hypothetical protein